MQLRQISKHKTNTTNGKSSFSFLTSLTISNQLQDRCPPFQMIIFDEIILMNIPNPDYLFSCLLMLINADLIITT